MSALNSELIKQMFGEVKQLIEQEKQEWEEEKAKLHRFDDCKIVLDVGGTCFSTSCSTLTKYPESMLGIMFSGRHDIEAMKCSDGSFFIDRDGTHFRHILNYLRDGAKAIHCFPKSHEIMQEILHEAMYYQLEGLVTAAQNRAVSNTISQNDIFQDFVCIKSNLFYNQVDGKSGASFSVSYISTQSVIHEHKTMRGVSFDQLEFNHPISFISCDLSYASFCRCSFKSTVTFGDCILNGTTFATTHGLVTNVHFIDCDIKKTNFEHCLKVTLLSAGKINKE